MRQNKELEPDTLGGVISGTLRTLVVLIILSLGIFLIAKSVVSCHQANDKNTVFNHPDIVGR